MALNSKQIEAVEASEGAVLVLAGAGTGKTTVLVEHVKHLIQNCKINPANIVATTFTVKATEEMKQRLTKQACQVPEWIGTFHSICIKIVRQHAEKLGISSDFKIIESEEQKQICKRLFGQRSEEVLEQINVWKNNCKKPKDVFQYHEFRSYYERYQQTLAEENQFDFGDLIMECCNLWVQFPEILEQYQKQFTHVCIDEFQDTNAVQFLWLQLLASGGQKMHIFCVGDDDQAIYGFRGSDNTYILNFRTYFPEAMTIKLEDNYRSTDKILDAALKVVELNQGRLGKRLISHKGTGEDVEIVHFPNSYRESVWLVDSILKHKGTVGILVRTMWQVAEVAKVLRSKGLVGGVGINIVMSYLHFLNHTTFEKLAEIVQLPKRGIGPASVEKIIVLGKRWQETNPEQKPDLAILEAIAHQTCSRSTQKEAVMLLFQQLNEWSQMKDDCMELICKIWEAFLVDSPPVYLVQFARRFPLLQDFIANFHLPQISTLTIHAAKGLEFDTVYLLGWEENIFPHIRAILTNDIESERRLAYVAITRGKTKVFITHCAVRESAKGLLRKGPSRFLDVLS